MKSLMDLRNAIKASFDDRIAQSVQRISGGQARDFAEYRYNCGIMQGLLRASEVLDVAFKKLLDEEND